MSEKRVAFVSRSEDRVDGYCTESVGTEDKGSTMRKRRELERRYGGL